MAPKRRKIEPVTSHRAIETMPLDHLQCRDWGHSWRPFTAHWVEADKCFESVLRCQRCRSVRIRYLSARGELLSSRYDYADNYLVEGIGRLDSEDRNHIRLASVLRVIPPDTTEEG